MVVKKFLSFTEFLKKLSRRKQNVFQTKRSKKKVKKYLTLKELNKKLPKK